MMHEEAYWFWLSSIPGIGPVTAHALLRHFDSPQSLFAASEEALRGSKLVKPAMLAALLQTRKENAIMRAWESMNKKEIRFYSFACDEYPDPLRHLYDPPIALYVRGELPGPGELTLAAVGARGCTERGRRVTHRLCRGLAFSGLSILSGMARGIDSAAHRGCLDGFGRTYAVLGCGVDLCYPRENIDLYEEICVSGGLLSEFPPGTPPKPWRFPVRNRIIAALSQGILVVEARRRSGSLITAEKGLEMGKEIFAVPGWIDDPLSEGCNSLLRDGARLVMSQEDILDYYSLLSHQLHHRHPALSSGADRVYRSLGLVPRCVDEIAAISGLPVREILCQLADLELDGLISTVGKNQYVLRV